MNDYRRSMEEKYLGKKIKILDMSGEPRYTGRTGVVERVDDMGQLHGSWGGLAIIPGEDRFIIQEEEESI